MLNVARKDDAIEGEEEKINEMRNETNFVEAPIYYAPGVRNKENL